MPHEHFTFGPFMLDMDRGMLSRQGRPVAVGQKGLLLLQAFLRSPGKILDKASLMDAAWLGVAVEESNLSVQIAALRKLLGTAHDGSEWITTVPRVGYRFAGPVAPQTAAAERAEGNAQPRPSIAVLPFAMIGESDKEYLADGLTEDIITALSRFRWFRVIGRSSAFTFKGKQMDVLQAARELGARYVLHGSVRQSALRLRITAQFIDASDGSNVWAERYDLEMADVFAIQDEIAERVAGAIEPELLKTESHLAAMRHTGNMTAWDLVRQGMWHFHKLTREGHLAARTLFRRACAIDPDLPESHIWLGRVSAGISRDHRLRLERRSQRGQHGGCGCRGTRDNSRFERPLCALCLRHREQLQQRTRRSRIRGREGDRIELKFRVRTSGSRHGPLVCGPGERGDRAA